MAELTEKKRDSLKDVPVRAAGGEEIPDAR